MLILSLSAHIMFHVLDCQTVYYVYAELRASPLRVYKKFREVLSSKIM